MRITVAPGQWPGDRLDNVLAAVRIAAGAGADGVWVSEVNGYDAVGLAVLAAAAEPDLQVTIGPIAAAVRSPAQTAMAAATVAAVSNRPVRLALGAANPTIVGSWHGRPADRLATRVADHVQALRPALVGGRTAGRASCGFRLSVDPPAAVTVMVAALGSRMLAVAGTYGDAVVLNLVPPDWVPAMRHRVTEAAARAGRPVPAVAVWTPVGDPAASGARVARFLRPYAVAPGYAEILRACVPDRLDPRTGQPGPEALGILTSMGSPEHAASRVAAFAEAGADEVTAVVSTGDPAVEPIVRAMVDAAAGAQTVQGRS